MLPSETSPDPEYDVPVKEYIDTFSIEKLRLLVDGLSGIIAFPDNSEDMVDAVRRALPHAAPKHKAGLEAALEYWDSLDLIIEEYERKQAERN